VLINDSGDLFGEEEEVEVDLDGWSLPHLFPLEVTAAHLP